MSTYMTQIQALTWPSNPSQQRNTMDSLKTLLQSYADEQLALRPEVTVVTTNNKPDDATFISFWNIGNSGIPIPEGAEFAWKDTSGTLRASYVYLESTFHKLESSQPDRCLVNKNYYTSIDFETPNTRLRVETDWVHPPVTSSTDTAMCSVTFKLKDPSYVSILYYVTRTPYDNWLAIPAYTGYEIDGVIQHADSVAEKDWWVLDGASGTEQYFRTLRFTIPELLTAGTHTIRWGFITDAANWVEWVPYYGASDYSFLNSENEDNINLEIIPYG